MLFAGFLMTRLTKLVRLPNVTGYILAGVLIGPYLLDLIPQDVVQGMDFVTDVALAFIAFGVGKYFRLSRLRQNGRKVLILTVFEALTAAVLIFLVMAFVFRLSIPFFPAAGGHWSPMSALQGKVPGMNVVSSGAPGSGPKVTIRGLGSFGDTSPLYVVDGMFYDNINFLNNSDIQEISVLKDASAAAIYGVRAHSFRHHQ